MKSNFTKQKGLYVVEFTLLATVFFLFILGVAGLAGYMYVYNAANNAAREGARLAAVCGASSETTIKNTMTAKVPSMPAANIVFDYLPDGCESNNSCTLVTLTINSFPVSLPTPAIYPVSISIPTFTTTFVRESMNAAGNSNC